MIAERSGGITVPSHRTGTGEVFVDHLYDPFSSRSSSLDAVASARGTCAGSPDPVSAEMALKSGWATLRSGVMRQGVVATSAAAHVSANGALHETSGTSSVHVQDDLVSVGDGLPHCGK